MDRFMRAIKKDWEKALFGTMVLALLISLFTWLRDGAPSTDSRAKGNATPRRTLLGGDALAFLDPLEVPRIPENPFSFGYKAEMKRPWHVNRTERPKNSARSPGPASTTTTAASTPATPVAPATPAAPAKPPPPPPARVLTYRGYLESTSGQMVAFVTVLDPNTKKSRMERLSVGRDIDGIEIKNFSGEMLEVLDLNGKPLRIPKGGRRKIVLE